MLDKEVRANITYKTRSGRLATVLTVKAKGALPAVGIVHDLRGDKPSAWSLAGRKFFGIHESFDSNEDLVEIASPITHLSEETEEPRLHKLQRRIADDAARVTIECNLKMFCLSPLQFPRSWIFDSSVLSDEDYRDGVVQAIEYLEMRGLLVRDEKDPKFLRYRL